MWLSYKVLLVITATYLPEEFIKEPRIVIAYLLEKHSVISHTAKLANAQLVFNMAAAFILRQMKANYRLTQWQHSRLTWVCYCVPGIDV